MWWVNGACLSWGFDCKRYKWNGSCLSLLFWGKRVMLFSKRYGIGLVVVGITVYFVTVALNGIF